MTNLYKDFTDKRFLSDNRPWYKFALNLVPKVPKKQNEKVLDLGAGNGEFSIRLKLQNKKVYCADASSLYVRRLKKRNFEVKKSDFNKKLPYLNSCFDGVVSLEVIEHVVQAELFLSEINRILKKSGWLIISTPNISWIGYRWLALVGKVPFKEGYHFRFFNPHGLIKKLKEAGFEVKYSAHFTPLPFINRIKQFWIPIKFWPSLLAQDLVFLCRKK